jgi:flagellar hook-associated protein 3 FlgL
MSLYRVSTANSYDVTLNNIGKRHADMATSQEQLSTGKRVIRASDDAVAATLSERAQNRLARVEADQRALEASRTALTQAESALGEATDVMHRVRELMVQAGNPVLGSRERQDLALQLEGLREQMLGVANRADTSGLTLFGGLGGSEQPFVDMYGPNAGVRFDGLAGQYLPTEASLPHAIDGNNVWMNVPKGNGAFTVNLNVQNQGSVSVSSSVADISPPVAPPGTSLSVEFFSDPINGAMSYRVVDVTGNVVAPTAVYNSSGTPVTVGTITFDLQGIAKPGDSIDIIPQFDATPVFTGYSAVPETGNSGQLRASLGAFSGSTLPPALDTGGMGYEIEFLSNDTFRVREVLADTAAGDPAFSNNVILDPPALPVPPSTDTYSFAANKSISFSGVSLELQGAPKQGDKLNLLPVADGPGEIFQTIQNTIDALHYTGANQSAHLTQELARGLQEADAGLDRILAARGRLGEWLNRADSMEGLFADRALAYEKENSDLTDVDMVKAISKFEGQQVAYQAALQSYAQVQKLSLFQYIA